MATIRKGISDLVLIHYKVFRFAYLKPVILFRCAFLLKKLRHEISSLSKFMIYKIFIKITKDWLIKLHSYNFETFNC